jgi:hypothetical protein
MAKVLPGVGEPRQQVHDPPLALLQATEQKHSG